MRLERRAVLAGSAPGRVVKRRALELEYLGSLSSRPHHGLLLGIWANYFTSLCPHLQDETNASACPRGLWLKRFAQCVAKGVRIVTEPMRAQRAPGSEAEGLGDVPFSPPSEKPCLEARKI